MEVSVGRRFLFLALVATERCAAAVRARWDAGVAGLFGLSYFVALTDVRVLDPRATDVLSTADSGYHAIARDFAQWDAWHWPLARLENYMAPTGTSTVFADANPWVVITTKLLLPRDAPSLQLIGPWLALMFVLQGYFGARLTARFTRDRVACAIGGAIFATSPALAFRLAHDTLCAHFILLVLLEGALRPTTDARSSLGALVRAALVLVFAAGLHPTLLAISIPLALAVGARHVRRTWRHAMAFLALFAGPAAVWMVLGTLAPGVNTGTVGFGFFSTNLLSLLDPMDRSRSLFLPPLPHGPGQYEGIAYLGAGVIALLPLALAQLLRRGRALARQTWMLALALLVTWLFALSSRITFGDTLVADVTSLYAPFQRATEAFRSSGRFVWPLHYTVIAFAVFACTKRSTVVCRALLGVALVAQLVDAHHVDGRAVFSLGDVPPPPSAAWKLTRGEYERLSIDPPDIQGGFTKCPEIKNTPGSFMPLARVATRQHLVFNSGVTSRFDERRTIAACDQISQDRRAGRFDARTIYAPEPHVRSAYVDNASLTCGRLDGRDICVRRDHPTVFQRLLASPGGPELTLAGHPLLSFDSGAGDVVDGARYLTSPAILRLQHTSGAPHYFSFYGRIASDQIANRFATLLVTIDQAPPVRIALRHETFGATYRVSGGAPSTTVRFEVEGALGQANGQSPGQLWKLSRVEWFPAE